MKNNDLKQLAKITFSDGKVNEKVKEFVVNKLTKKEIKSYLFYLKNELQKSRVYVTISDIPNSDTLSKLSRIFIGREVNINVDKSLGAGLKVKVDDNIIHINVKNLIGQTIQKIKNSL